MTRSTIKKALAACVPPGSAPAPAAEERLSVKLRPAEKHLLEALAEERGWSMTDIIRRGLALVAQETEKGGAR